MPVPKGRRHERLEAEEAEGRGEAEGRERMLEVDMVHCGDCLEQLEKLPSNSVDCCVTSPPYFGLRDYGCDGQIGMEETPEAYVSKLVEVFREVRRVLKKEGTCWLNLGSSYINKKIESEEMVLRDNLTYDEMQYIFQELLKNVENLPRMRRAEK